MNPIVKERYLERCYRQLDQLWDAWLDAVVYRRDYETIKLRIDLLKIQIRYSHDA